MDNTIPVPHPLYGAEIRVRRAGEHIDDLRKILQAWADEHREIYQVTPNAEGTGTTVEQAKVPDIDLLGQASVRISDALFNLRAALDYTVYVLACVGNGWKHVSGTQFLIDDDMDDFEERAKKYLRHVPLRAVQLIRELQPGWTPPCEWTRLLRDLSNPDKHRTLTSLRSVAEVLTQMTGGEMTSAGQVVNVQTEFRVRVLFKEENVDTADTLQLLHREVGSTVALFKPGIHPVEASIV